MSKLNVMELNKELLNKEISFSELDSYMTENGYYSIFDDGVVSDVKDSKNVVYTAVDTCEAEVLINFEITVDNRDDEAEDSFELKVTGVDTI